MSTADADDRHRQDGYLLELAERLRAHGLPADRVEATVMDLGAHLAECGAGDAEAEFGPAEEFARQLVPDTGVRAPADPGDEVETWRWTADAYVDEALLNRFGDEGWEVQRVDAVGRFVSHRDVAQPQRWEYRRELVTRGRADVDLRLAPDGWEACGDWLVYAYYKRPRAASLGPAARVDSPPPAPERSSFFSRKFCALLAVFAAALVVAGVVAAVGDGDASSGLGFVTGGIVGAAIPAAAAWTYQRRRARRS